MQAIVRSGKSQFTIKAGDELLLDTPTIDQILSIIDGENVKVGTPEVDGAQIKITNLGAVRGPKIRSFKYKAKSRYRKVHGFRAKLFRIKVDSISVK